MEQTDYYEILGVSKDADVKQIKEAYRERALKYHPDRNHDDPESADKMKAVNEAYAVLSNADKRREYDMLKTQFGSSAYNQFRQNYTDQDIFNGSDIFNIFEEITKGFGLRGFDELFKEFYGNGYQTFEYRKPGFSARSFVFSGQFGKKPQEQVDSPMGKKMGKFSRYVFKKISGVDLPENGEDITDSIQIDSKMAAEGGGYAYFNRKMDKKLVVKIPAGIRDGQRIRLAGMGMQGKNGGSPGDLFLNVRIQKPLLKRIRNFVTSLWK